MLVETVSNILLNKLLDAIDCYDRQENSKHNMERLDFYFPANNIGLDYKSNNDTKKELHLNSVKLYFQQLLVKRHANCKRHSNVIMVHFLSRSLRDEFVSDVADVETQRKLLKVERDFDACIKIALSFVVAS